MRIWRAAVETDAFPASSRTGTRARARRLRGPHQGTTSSTCSTAQPPTGPASPRIEIAANGHPPPSYTILSTPFDDLQRRHVGPRRPADPSSGRKLLRYIVVGRAGRGRRWPAVLPPFGPPLVTPMPPNHVPSLSPTRASSRHLRLTPTTTRLEAVHEGYPTCDAGAGRG